MFRKKPLVAITCVGFDGGIVDGGEPASSWTPAYQFRPYLLLFVFSRAAYFALVPFRTYLTYFVTYFPAYFRQIHLAY
jgi:hypothetical protein